MICKFCELKKVNDGRTIRGKAEQVPEHDIYLEKEGDLYLLDIGCDLEDVTHSICISYCPMCGRKLEEHGK